MLDEDTLVSRLLERRLTMNKLLLFDAWHDFISSPGADSLKEHLKTLQTDDRRLAEKLAYSLAARATDTDQWMRLFISVVRDMDEVAVCVCDMSLGGLPIIHTNAGFHNITGYTLDEVVGRSCRFLQGPKTDATSVATIREAIRTGTSCKLRLVNYRKDGSIFNNMISLRPLF